MSENPPHDEPPKPDPAKPRADMVDLEERLEDLLIAAGRQAGTISEELGVEPIDPDAPRGIPVDPSPAGVRAAPSIEAQLAAIDGVVKTAAAELGATRVSAAAPANAASGDARPDTPGADSRQPADKFTRSAGPTPPSDRPETRATPPDQHPPAAAGAAIAPVGDASTVAAATANTRAASPPDLQAPDETMGGERDGHRLNPAAIVALVALALAGGLRRFDRLFRWVPVGARNVIGLVAVVTLLMAAVAWVLVLLR